MVLLIGIGGFLLFFLSDWNDLHWGRKGLRFCFPLGAALLTGATAAACCQGSAPVVGGLRAAAGVLALIFLALEVYALFFALPPKASYTAPGERRETRAAGVYALCRHPGVLFFVPLYICLWIGFGLPPLHVTVYVLLDVLLVVYEDFRVFPAVLEGYGDYRKQAPFLIPNSASLRACLRRENK